MSGNQDKPPQGGLAANPVACSLPPNPDTALRSNNFNVLRLLFASLVILSHSSALIDGDSHRDILMWLFHTETLGGVAVDGFFLISGFLIVQSWRSNPWLPDFIKNRVLRIYPAFVFASLLSALVVGPLGSDPGVYFGQFSGWQYVKSVCLLNMPVVPTVFAGQPFQFVNGSLWTITYEFRCYLLAALLGLCGVFYRRWCWAVLTAGVIVMALVLDVLNRIPFLRWLEVVTVNPVELAKFFAFFSAGGFFYMFRDRIPRQSIWALVAIAILISCLFWARTAEIALATAGAYLLFWFAFARVPWLERFQTCPDISYGVYLYGWPAQKLLLWYLPWLTPWLLFPAALGASCLAGWLSWHWVERPFLSLKRRPDRARLPA
ncbi:MAG: acyltransferase [Verrucomicrobiae bacterium]|nr:acyltransferase [Verrucomicrobiae bacterium]